MTPVDERIQPLVGQTVTAMSTVAPWRARFGTAWVLTVEGTIVCTIPGQAEQQWDGDAAATDRPLGTALPGQQVTAAGIEAGRLRLTFSSGTVLCMVPDARYESWSLTGPDQLLIVCFAAGELAVWHPAATASPDPPD